jgi:signal transduction histidine kinase/ActR/RegA family two-component response regulator
VGSTIHSGSVSAPRGHGLDFLPEEGEAAQLIREYDWSSTPLGHPSHWSPSLRMMVRFLLANRFPMLLWWGPEYVQIYNDAYAPILGAKHPDQAMGKPFRECWHEVYEVLGPMVDTPFSGGPSTWMEDLELIVRRHGFPEESHFTIAYSPVPDDTAPRGIGGVLATVHEISEQIIGERRLKILSELGARVAEAKTDEQACVDAIDTLSRHPKDVPFAMLYLVDDVKRELRRVSATGITVDSACPAVLGLDTPMTEVPWPLAPALQTETIQWRDGMSTLLSPVAAGPWPDPPDSVAVVPIKSNVARRPAGVLVVGISACIRFDNRYTSFLELLGAQVATAVANARAWAEERRRAEALAEIDRAKTAFFSNVSHEFRTPLTLMLGPLDDVLSMPAIPAGVRPHVEVAHRNAQRLLKLVNSLLDFARIEAGRIEASFAPVDLALLTADLASTFRSAMERAKLDYQVDCPPLGEPVYLDREMWEKIVLNLLSNAFKFTLEGRVRIGLARVGDQAVLEVSDTGAGVPEHEIPHLFDRFHRVEGTEARTHEGSGIGLALVQELVRLHGGSIEVASQLGSGTTFRIRIPFGTAHIRPERIKTGAVLASTATSAQAYVQDALRWLPDGPDEGGAKLDVLDEAAGAKRDQRFASTFGSRVLLADDNADMRAYIRELLGPLYEVEAVADGADALEAARRERPDLILTDVMMPRMDGFELLTTLRADRGLCDIPVIVLSARAGEESRIEGLGAGADDYLVKPFHARELRARVGAILELTHVRRTSEEQFRAYVQATSDVIYRMSPDWSEMRQMEGRNFIDDQAGGTRTWMDKYIHDDDQPRVRAAIDEAIRTRSPFEIEHRVIRPDGSPGWTFSRAIPLFDDHGEIVEWFGAASDVTAQREAQDALERQRRKLEEADRQKNEFLAMLAHELRNPLAPIRNAGELLSRGMVADPQGRLALATVERQVRHLTRLVDDLLDISRITQGQIELRRGPVRLEHVIAQAVEAVDPLIQQKQHQLAVISSRKQLIVDGDPERLVQCIGNILTNSAKYTPPDGEIRIESRRENGTAVVTIRDNGVGIPPELLPTVFDLFVQGERTLDRAQGGLGVGLTIVRRLVEMHGGSITAASPGMNQGATFEIRLPLAHEGTTAHEALPVRQVRTRRILVVDDNEDGVEMMARLLQFDGHEVETALSGSEALERLATFRPEVAILDIGLPGLDGYEVARRIHANTDGPLVHLIAVTGYGREEDRDRAREAGFAAHLVKPVEFSALQRVLAGL